MKVEDFNCPKCGKDYKISDFELWEVYDDDGKETCFKCVDCESELIITSTVDSWSFVAEINE